MKKFSARLVSITTFNADTHRVLLDIGQPAPLPFRAGQYLQLIMSDGSPRAFSIASAPHEALIELHIRAVAGHIGALEVMDYLQRSAAITIELAHGSGVLPKSARPLLMIAGGTGLAPMKALISDSVHRQESRAIELYWGVSDPEALYWHEELLALCTQHPRLRYVPVIANPVPDWNGESGFPHVVAARDHDDLARFEVFCSGSEAMARGVFAFMQQRGVTEPQFHCDWIPLLRAQGTL